MYKKIVGRGKQAWTSMRNYWKNVFNNSRHNKISRGSENITHSITSSHSDQWRRGDK